ncbi:MAG: hypothetical protein ABGX31_04785 [bacterium]
MACTNIAWAVFNPASMIAMAKRAINEGSFATRPAGTEAGR